MPSSPQKSIFITGGTGLIGSALLPTLAQLGYHGFILTRSLNKKQMDIPEPFRTVEGDIIHSRHWYPLLSQCSIVLHLAGHPLFKSRWNQTTKDLIRDSRVIGTQNLTDAIINLPAKQQPQTFIQASAIGYYGTSDDEIFDESSPPGEDFLANVARDWEHTSRMLQDRIKNITIFRIGIVLSLKGGLLERILPIFRSGLGGKLSTGNQWISWIHEADVVQALLAAITQDTWKHDTYNLTSPHPVRNAQFTNTLSSLVGRPSFLTVPRPFLKALLGEGSQYLTQGQCVKPKKLREQDFIFRHPTLESALKNLLSEP